MTTRMRDGLVIPLFTRESIDPGFPTSHKIQFTSQNLMWSVLFRDVS